MSPAKASLMSSRCVGHEISNIRPRCALAGPGSNDDAGDRQQACRNRAAKKV